jgi:hypothetical protein
MKAVVDPLLHNSDPLKGPAVNTEFSQLLTTVIVGVTGIKLTVKVAGSELTEAPLFVHTARYCLLLSAGVVDNDKEPLVAPLISFQIVPFVLSCHCTVGAGVPLAAEVKLTLAPAHRVWEVGWVVTVGGILAGAAVLLISNSAVLAC